MALVTHRVPDGTEADDIRHLALDVRGRMPRSQPAVVMIVGVPADRPVVVVAVNEAGRGFGLSAGTLVGVAARALGGGGGGRPDVAQGGGAPLAPDSSVVDEAFGAVRAALRDIHGSAG
jgi:alanyl-tRNA synthetase